MREKVLSSADSIFVSSGSSVCVVNKMAGVIISCIHIEYIYCVGIADAVNYEYIGEQIC